MSSKLAWYTLKKVLSEKLVDAHDLISLEMHTSSIRQGNEARTKQT